jgi:DNA-binding NtrC family response regulator
MRLGAFDYIQKPFNAEEVALLVERAVAHRTLRNENEALKTSLQDMAESRRLVGESREMQRVREAIDRIVASTATVLVQGESGTGKELVARAIHAASPRADRPMLCLNCAALSASLLESELFGHERGAFTGADRVRKGRFELADGGTLLLDEISEIPMALQAKLLRVLQEKQFERVGSSVTRQADVRIIATTNRDLTGWVARKRFREDLYYRISVLPLHLRPLRERRDDIELLVHHFLERASRREGRAALEVTDDAMDLLGGYHWPGNVRELENVCERASVLVEGDTLSAETIKPWLAGREVADEPFARLRSGHMVEDMERQLIERMLKQFNGHRAKTAAALGIGLRTLGMKVKKWREQEALAAATSEHGLIATPARAAG